jgi:hypothetical protein
MSRQALRDCGHIRTMNRAFSAAGCFWLPHPGRRYALPRADMRDAFGVSKKPAEWLLCFRLLRRTPL